MKKKLDKTQVNAMLKEVASTKNTKRDKKTLLPINKQCEIYDVKNMALDCDTVKNCNAKIAEIANETQVTKCCVSTGKTGGKGKVFYQLNNVEVWLETRDICDIFGCKNEKEPKQSATRQQSEEKRIIAILKENKNMNWAAAAEMVATEKARRQKEAADEKKMQKAFRIGLTREQLKKMLESME